MMYYITQFESTGHDGAGMMFRTDDLIKWLDRIQELKKERHLKKNRCAFWLNVRQDGSAQTFFSFCDHALYRKDKQVDLPFCRKPSFIWEGFPEGDE